MFRFLFTSYANNSLNTLLCAWTWSNFQYEMSSRNTREMHGSLILINGTVLVSGESFNPACQSLNILEIYLVYFCYLTAWVQQLISENDVLEFQKER